MSSFTTKYEVLAEDTWVCRKCGATILKDTDGTPYDADFHAKWSTTECSCWTRCSRSPSPQSTAEKKNIQTQEYWVEKINQYYADGHLTATCYGGHQPEDMFGRSCKWAFLKGHLPQTMVRTDDEWEVVNKKDSRWFKHTQLAEALETLEAYVDEFPAEEGKVGLTVGLRGIQLRQNRNDNINYYDMDDRVRKWELAVVLVHPEEELNITRIGDDYEYDEIVSN